MVVVVCRAVIMVVIVVVMVVVMVVVVVVMVRMIHSRIAIVMMLSLHAMSVDIDRTLLALAAPIQAQPVELFERLDGVIEQRLLVSVDWRMLEADQVVGGYFQLYSQD